MLRMLPWLSKVDRYDHQKCSPLGFQRIGTVQQTYGLKESLIKSIAMLWNFSHALKTNNNRAVARLESSLQYQIHSRCADSTHGSLDIHTKVYCSTTTGKGQKKIERGKLLLPTMRKGGKRRGHQHQVFISERRHICLRNRHSNNERSKN